MYKHAVKPLRLWPRSSAPSVIAVAIIFTLGFLGMHGPRAIAATTDVNDACNNLSTLEKNVKDGDRSARTTLSNCYVALGNAANDAHKPAEAVNWYRKAAMLGNAMGEVLLGGAYQEGQGVARDDQQAMEWYRKAAESGDPRVEPGAAAIYGFMTLYCNCGDTYLGAVYIQKAARMGDQHAMTMLDNAAVERLLGIAYAKGDGVAKNDGQAAEWYKKAAAKGDVNAELDLGVAYANGTGVPKDLARAITWWNKAAEKDEPNAQHNLGLMYQYGHGVPVNPAAAADWYYKAGITYLKRGERDDALFEAQLIRSLQRQYNDLPNGFLAKDLIEQIYGPPTSTSSKPAEQAVVHEGTGWPIAGGYVVTNHHVIAGGQTIWIVVSGGARMRASIAADDVNNDLVLLRVDDPAALPPALPIAQQAAQVGESVFALGYPHPDLMGTDVKLTEGIISAGEGPGNDPRVYQMSAPVQSGNSGGPLLDMDGEVVGIVSAKLDAAKVFKLTGDLPENVNYAIKVSYLDALIQSVSSPHKIPVLPASHASLEVLDKRIAPSIVMILAMPPIR